MLYAEPTTFVGFHASTPGAVGTKGGTGQFYVILFVLTFNSQFATTWGDRAKTPLACIGKTPPLEGKSPLNPVSRMGRKR